MYAAIDFETANGSRNSACAIGLVKFNKNEIVSSEYYLIKPHENYFHWMNTKIHKITWEDVKNEKIFPDIWNIILPKLNEVEFIAAHNAVFDKSVLNASCKHYALNKISKNFVCTWKDIADSLWGFLPDKKLKTICEYLGISLRHHNVRSDTEACAKIVIRAFNDGWKFN